MIDNAVRVLIVGLQSALETIRNATVPGCAILQVRTLELYGGRPIKPAFSNGSAAAMKGLLTRVYATPSESQRPVFETVVARDERETPAPREGSPVACGPAAVVIQLALIGKGFVDDDLLALVDADGQTSLDSIARYAHNRGLCAYAGRLAPQDLASLPWPAILYTSLPSTDGNDKGHFIVYVSSAGSDSAFVYDPNGSNRMRGPVSLEALASVWSGVALVIAPEPVSDWETSSQTARIVNSQRQDLPIAAFAACAGIIAGGLVVGMLLRRR